MNNFIFENAAKVYFGKGCVREYLCCKVKNCGDTVMLAYGGGSIKKNGIYEEVVSILKAAGTGSECNGGAVITNEELKIKTGRDYPKCNPKFALLDPSYTYSVPKFQMVSGGFDILSHIKEEFWTICFLGVCLCFLILKNRWHFSGRLYI